MVALCVLPKASLSTKDPAEASYDDGLAGCDGSSSHRRAQSVDTRRSGGGDNSGRHLTEKLLMDTFKKTRSVTGSTEDGIATFAIPA